MDEESRIEMLRRVLASQASGIRVGIGDDAAVLDPDLVWTIDEQVEGIHFRRDMLSLEDLGWRSLMSAASDIAAMGADPWCALASIVVPRSLGDDELEAIARGQSEAARAIACPVVGGNLSSGDAISISTTVLGKSSAPILRSGAKPGDRVHLAGDLGLAAAGRIALMSKVPLDSRAWRRPIARIIEGRAMRGNARAAIDVSDGLAIDAHRMARASSVRLVIDAKAIVSDALRAAASALSENALELALGGGEDYAIVCTSPAPIEGFTSIGVVEAGSGVELDEAGTRRALEPRGWDHFRT